MRTFGVIVDAPFLNDYLGFLETVEEFAVDAFVPELAVERFAIAVLPR